MSTQHIVTRAEKPVWCALPLVRVCGFAGLRVCGFAGLRVCGFASLKLVLTFVGLVCSAVPAKLVLHMPSCIARPPAPSLPGRAQQTPPVSRPKKSAAPSVKAPRPLPRRSFSRAPRCFAGVCSEGGVRSAPPPVSPPRPQLQPPSPAASAAVRQNRPGCLAEPLRNVFVFFVNNVNQVTTYNWLATGKRTQEVPKLQGKREGMSLCVCVCVCVCECCK